jgi:outer membrane lipoprotein-sorting protein
MVPFRSHLAEVGRGARRSSQVACGAHVSSRAAIRVEPDSRVRQLAGCLGRASSLTLFLVLAQAGFAQPARISPVLQAWLNSQTNLHTWFAEVTQTRMLKTLSEPLVAKGQVWFAAPDRFRWQIGTITGTGATTNTIALRQADQLFVIYPRFKRAERYPLNGDQAGPWKDALALLEAGFPRSQLELERRFKILALTQTNALCEVALQPRSASARRLMPQVKIAFERDDFSLRVTELQFADGSTLRNEFSHARLNPDIPEGVFTPSLDADYQVVEPLKK